MRFQVLESVSILPPWLLVGLSPLLLATALLAVTRAYTTVRYRGILAQHTAAVSARETKSPCVLPPPPLPYTLPFLGNALAFLAPVPGEFWTKDLFARIPRWIGACTLYLGGRTLQVLLSPAAVQALLRHRVLARHSFNVDLQVAVFGCSRADSDRTFGVASEGPDAGRPTLLQHLEEVNHHYLLRADRVSELTDRFMRRLLEELPVAPAVDDAGVQPEAETIVLYDWLWPRIFAASTAALFGADILEVYPSLPADFRAFDAVVTHLLFGLPRFVIPKAFALRERCLTGIQHWLEAMRARCGGDGVTVDPEGRVAWEPRYGSRFSRAKQLHYAAHEVGLPGRASLTLGLLFGLSSNAIPTTGWLLCHLLDPRGDPTVLPRLRAEIESVPLRDGVPDAGPLCALPLLQSVYTEVLRLYVDIFILRNIDEDMTLPLDDAGRRAVRLRRGDVVFAASWVGHHDEETWSGTAPADTFYAERFLTRDPTTGQEIFSTAGTAGKLFPFGGGKGLCPGRSFAKQEVLGVVAVLLLTYEFEFVEFLDEKREATAKFVQVKQAMSGSGAIALGGDMKVKIRPRRATKS